MDLPGDSLDMWRYCFQARKERVVFGIAGGFRAADQSSFLLPCCRDPRQPRRSRCARRFRWYEIVRRRGEKPHEGFLASITSVWPLSKIPTCCCQLSKKRRQVLDKTGDEVAQLGLPSSSKRTLVPDSRLLARCRSRWLGVVFITPMVVARAARRRLATYDL